METNIDNSVAPEEIEETDINLYAKVREKSPRLADILDNLQRYFSFT